MGQLSDESIAGKIAEQISRIVFDAPHSLRMEKEFDIEIKEVLSRVETVKAESLDDAINKAMDMYYSEQIVLDAEDMKGVDFSPYSEEQLPSSLKENGGKTR